MYLHRDERTLFWFDRLQGVADIFLDRQRFREEVAEKIVLVVIGVWIEHIVCQ